MRPLVWFRADLRVRDNTALHHAGRTATRGVVGVFLVCPEQWREHDWADVKVDFILRTLEVLADDLEERGIPLLVPTVDRFDDAGECLLDLARRHACDAIYYNREYEVNEHRRDEAVGAAFARAGLEAHGFCDQVVVSPGAIRTGTGGFYKVFTPFRRAWLERVEEGGVPRPLARPPRQETAPAESDPIPDRVEGFDPGLGRPELWPAGEDEARRRLRRFVRSGISSYQKRRDLPAEDGTSALSPYLTVGAVSPRQCLHAAVEANGGKLDGGDDGPATWITELVWREFYRHVLVGYPRVSMHRAFQAATEKVRWRDDPEGLAAWCEGRTGVPIVDAAMRQLLETGWMHNRLRMISATFLTKDLLIDWRAGERHFMRHLVDGDLASNNGGWQWSASTGTDAAPYFRVFNPFSQSRKVDPDGAFIRRYVPELAGVEGRAVHDPSALPASARDGLDYPEPIVDHDEARRRAIAEFERAMGRAR